MPELPAGTVTFLFTDIEGSTALLKQLGRDGYESVLSEQAGIVRAAVDAHHGQIVDTQGDSFFAAFRAARDAVAAAADVQRELAGHDWPDGVEVKVRMGLHSGEPKASGERYVGIGVHRAARVGSAGHGGQVLLSDTTRALVEDDLPEGVSLRDLGRVQLKDIDRPEHVYQLAIAGLPSTFPKLKTAQAPPPYRRRGLLAGALAGVIAAAVAIPVFALGGGSGGSVGSAVEANVAADSVGVFDSSRGQLVSQAAVKGGPGAVAAAGDGSVWVTHPDANSVSRIDPKLNAETQTIQVGDDPRAVTVGGGFVWVANSLDGTVWKIDPNANGSGGVVDRFTVGNGPTGLAFGDGRLWVANSTDGTVMEFVPGSHKPLHTFSAAGGADAISYGLGSVWVVSGSGNSVTRIDPSSGTPLSPIGVGNDPGSIATGAGAVWVADTLDGTVYRIDPLTNDRTVISVGGSPSGIAADDTAVWVADERAGRLSKIDPAKSKVVQTVTLARHNRPWGLTLVGSRLFASVGTSASAHRGGTLTVLTASDTLDPAAAGSSGIVNLTNDGLVGYTRVVGSDGTRLVPDLAISLPAPTDGGKTYTFQLQPGIRYSNGALVQPGDFRRGIERSLALFGNSGPSSQYLVGIVGANACTKHRCDLTRGVATTPHTVTFHLTAPDPDFLYKLAFPDADAVPAATPINARLPLPATGPYKFASYNAKRGATLVRNPYFRQWSADAQPAGYPDRIVFKFVPSNQTDAQSIRAVERNRADVTEIGSLTGMLRRQGYGNRIHIGPTLNTNYFFLNTRLAPFDNLQARRAVNFAVDRNRLVALAGGPDFGQPTCQILPPTFPAYLRYCPYPFDLAKARRLVAKSGTKGKTVTVWTPRLAEPGSAYFVSQLQAIGYKARLKIVGQGLDTYFSKMIPAEKTIQTGVASWGVDYASPSDFLGLLVCGPNSLNFAAFCNPRIDREMAAARKLQATNPQAADVIWKKVDHDLVDQAPWVTKANGRQVLFVSRRVGNVEYNPFYTVLLDQLWVR